MQFKDYFSEHSEAYKKFRPGYPDELFAYLAGVCPATGFALDCAAGSGQAACGLSPYFPHVIALDASFAQISARFRKDNVFYAVALSEVPCLKPGQFALIAVAQAAHWFDLPRFYEEASSLLVDGGCLALWCYGLLRISPGVDSVIDQFYKDTIGPHWPPERKLVDEAYQGIPFPFPELSPPSFSIKVQWTLDTLIGYLHTWSAVKKYQKAHGESPLDLIAEDLLSAWGERESARDVCWPIHMRLGKKKVV